MRAATPGHRDLKIGRPGDKLNVFPHPVGVRSGDRPVELDSSGVALIPPSFIDSVVALGTANPSGPRWVGTGFLYLDVISRDGDTARGHCFLVTNKHVVEGRTNLSVRVNPQNEGGPRDYELSLTSDNAEHLWTGHPDPEIDVAVVNVNLGMLNAEGMAAKPIHSDRQTADAEKLKELGVAEGDGAFVLGFPMGMVSDRRAVVIVRGATIARLQDLLAGHSKEFLVDASVFPGNSGGPVLLKPELTSIRGTTAQTSAYLIGVVKSYLTYTDVAVSIQTNRPRITFQENAGLASCHSVTSIVETIAQFKLDRSATEQSAEEVVTDVEEGPS